MIRLARASFACRDPRRLETFWSAVCEWDVPLAFREAPKTPTIEAPVHLDVNAPDPEAELPRLLELGAKLVVRKHERIGPIDEAWTVLRDPEGNGFCLQGSRPGRERPYLGNVTFACASPPALAAFWREALGYGRTELPAELERDILAAGVDPAEFEAYDDAVPPDGLRPRLLFQRREKTPAPEPALRLELATDDVEAAAARLVELGAAPAGGDLLADPEGNLFALGRSTPPATSGAA